MTLALALAGCQSAATSSPTSPSTRSIFPITTTTGASVGTTTANPVGDLSSLALHRAGGFEVLAPKSWKYEDFETGDHSTFLWSDPFDALKKLQVVVNRCVGCIVADITTDDLRPDAAQAVPTGDTRILTNTPTEADFTYFGDATDPYPDNGIVRVLLEGNAVNGYDALDLHLPDSEGAIVSAILNSFAILPADQPPCTERALHDAVANAPGSANPNYDGSTPDWTITDFKCVPDFAAVGQTAPGEQGAIYLFEADDGEWSYVTDGTGGFCQPEGKLTQAQGSVLGIC